MYSHQYETTDCPHCLVDLTEPESVVIEGRDNSGKFLGEHLTSLDEKGNLLPDGDGILKSGFHSGTRCNYCGQAIDQFEVV